MNVLAADAYILCGGLLRTLMLLYDDVCVTPANSIDEVLARIPELPDLDLVLLDASMPGMENFAGVRRTVEKRPEVPVIVTSPTEGGAHVTAHAGGLEAFWGTGPLSPGPQARALTLGGRDIAGVTLRGATFFAARRVAEPDGIRP
jgi:CheY-like chemotaxis protein